MPGIKVTLRDPDDSTNVIRAEFATARTHPELKDKLKTIASCDTKESLLGRRRELAMGELATATTETELNEAAEALQKATDAVNDASMALFEAIRDFIVAGFQLAGATQELAEKLAGLVDVERLPELKAKCLFGAGVVDFTRGDAR